MNYRNLVFGLLATASAVSMTGQAQAAGTTAGTQIDNSATLGYSTGGVAQPAVTSNTASFRVDQRVNLTVAEVGGTATSTAPGQADRVTTFTVTNSTNAAQDFRLTATQDANGTTAAFGGSDNFNANNVRVFVDANANGAYEAGTDTATFIDELAADQSRTVFIVVDVPTGQANASIAGVTLTATAAASGAAATLGVDMVQTGGAEDANTVEIVFGDIAGDTDGSRDGSHSDDDQYGVAAATMSLTKTTRVVSDPFNGITNPRRIPGSVIEYCLIVANSGGADATGVSIADNLATVTGVTYVASSIFNGVTVTAGVCNADGTGQTDATDGDNGQFATNIVSATIPTVTAGASTAMRFRVTVN